MDKHLKNALEQVELATSHLTIAIHEFTQAGAPTPENWTGVPKYDQAIFIIAKDIVEAVQMIQPTLSFLHKHKVFKMPPEAMKLLREHDPETYNEASMRVAAGSQS